MKILPALSCALLLAALFPVVARAQGGDRPSPRTDPWMGDASVSLNQDAASGKRGVSCDANMALFFVNAGLSLRAWDGAITGWNGRQVSDEAVVYAGIGLGDLLTVQRGWSRAGARYRIRALISFGPNFPLPSDEQNAGLFNREVAVTPFLEVGDGKRVFGVGLVMAM